MVAASELKDAFFWGSCQKHYQCFSKEKTWNGKAFFHLSLAAIEAIPLLGQIISLIEMLFKSCFGNPSAQPIENLHPGHPKESEPLESRNLRAVTSDLHPKYLQCFENTGVAVRTNKEFNERGESRRGAHECEDRWAKQVLDQNIYYWGLFDGHGGPEVAEMAASKFADHLTLQKGSPLEKAITDAYCAFNQEYFNTQQENISALIKAQKSAEEIKARYPDLRYEWEVMKKDPEFSQLTGIIFETGEALKPGSTACTLLLVEDCLVAANVGDSRIVLVLESQDQLTALQLSVDHDPRNEDELKRLEKIGLDPKEIQKNGRVGNSQVTRSFGDFELSRNWKTFKIVEHASSAPVICDPHVSDPITITPDHAFAFLMSDGIYDAVSLLFKCGKKEANDEIAKKIHAQLKKGDSASEAAQEILNWIDTEQREACRRGNAASNRLDDLTLMIIPFKTY